MNIQQHRRDRDRAVNLAITPVCGLGFAGALSPAVEHAVTTALVAVVMLALLVAGVRWVVRRLRERREDAADALAGAAWRARHMPHVAALLDQLDQHSARHDRAGVA